MPGAMMSVDETLMCSFQILKPAERKTTVRVLDGGQACHPAARGAGAESVAG